MHRTTNTRAIALYQQIMRHIATNQTPPSYREVATMLGAESTSTAGYYLNILERWGWIERLDNERRGRNIRLTRATERGLTFEQLSLLVYG